MPSYKQRESGLWTVRFRETLPDGTTKNTRLSSFKTKREAQEGYHQYLNEKKEQEAREARKADPSNMLFSDLVEHYIEYSSSRIRTSTFYTLNSKINNRILPYFADMRMEEITPIVVQRWLVTLSDYSYYYVKGIFSSLNAIFNFAEKYFGILNVCRKVDKPRNRSTRKNMNFWTPDEFVQFISCVDHPRYRIFFLFLYESGCRRGEGEVLGWEDFNFETESVKISKSISYIGQKGSWIITPPKTESSNRELSLSHYFFNELKEYREWQLLNESGSRFVFGSSDPPVRGTLDHNFKKYIEISGVKKIRIHDLRHSCASILLSRCPVIPVSKYLGHSTPTETLNTYGHMIPDDHQKLLQTFNDLGTRLGALK